MNCEVCADLFLLFLAALTGGIIGGAIGAVLSRASADKKPKRHLFVLPRRSSSKILPFPTNRN